MLVRRVTRTGRETIRHLSGHSPAHLSAGCVLNELPSRVCVCVCSNVHVFQFDQFTSCSHQSREHADAIRTRGILLSIILYSTYYTPSPPDRAVSAKLHAGFIQMTQSIFAQGRNSGFNSQMLSNLDKTTVSISILSHSTWF